MKLYLSLQQFVAEVLEGREEGGEGVLLFFFGTPERLTPNWTQLSEEDLAKVKCVIDQVDAMGNLVWIFDKKQDHSTVRMMAAGLSGFLQNFRLMTGFLSVPENIEFAEWEEWASAELKKLGLDIVVGEA